ncbi:hypothetical protein HK104_004985, partial [Borealophlyctis nickersoniae]
CYLNRGSTPWEDAIADPTVCNIRETDFSGYPRDACVLLGGKEVFRDDNLAWVEKAREGGVRVRSAVEEKMWHVFAQMEVKKPGKLREDVKRSMQVAVDFLSEIVG